MLKNNTLNTLGSQPNYRLPQDLLNAEFREYKDALREAQDLLNKDMLI